MHDVAFLLCREPARDKNRMAMLSTVGRPGFPHAPRGLGVTGLNLEKMPSRPCESGTSDCGDSVINRKEVNTSHHHSSIAKTISGVAKSALHLEDSVTAGAKAELVERGVILTSESGIALLNLSHMLDDAVSHIHNCPGECAEGEDGRAKDGDELGAGVSSSVDYNQRARRNCETRNVPVICGWRP